MTSTRDNNIESQDYYLPHKSRITDVTTLVLAGFSGQGSLMINAEVKT